jgi:hypothetical protein
VAMSIDGGLYRLERLAKRQLLAGQATGGLERRAKTNSYELSAEWVPSTCILEAQIVTRASTTAASFPLTPPG